MGNKDKTQDKNAATSTDASRDQESRDAALARTITVAVAGALTHTHVQYESRQVAHKTFLLRLRLLPVQKVLEFLSKSSTTSTTRAQNRDTKI